MVLSFSKELPSSSTVDVVLSNAADKDEASTEEIVATRVNPYTYSFDAPSGLRKHFLTFLRFFRIIVFHRLT